MSWTVGSFLLIKLIKQASFKKVIWTLKIYFSQLNSFHNHDDDIDYENGDDNDNDVDDDDDDDDGEGDGLPSTQWSYTDLAPEQKCREV